MTLHLITGFASGEAAEAASQKLYNLTRPASDPEKLKLLTTSALAWRRHPDREEWALLLDTEDFDASVSPILHADPGKADPGVLAELMTDPQASIMAVLQMARIGADTVLAALDPERVLSPGDEGYAVWFADAEVDP